MGWSNQHSFVLFEFQFPTLPKSAALIGKIEQQSFADTVIAIASGGLPAGLPTHVPFFLYLRFPQILISCL